MSQINKICQLRTLFLLTVLNWTYVIPAQITLSAKEKAETDLTVPPRDRGSSSMLHTLFVNKALFMLRYLKLLVQKETESTENTFRTVWLSLIEVTSMKSLSRLL